MSLLDEVVAAMDHADVEAALAYVGREFVRSGRLPGPADVATATGMHALSALCEAYGLDLDEVTQAASTRGTFQLQSTMSAFNRAADPREAAFLAGMVAGGIMTGLRIGLMVADHRTKGGV